MLGFRLSTNVLEGTEDNLTVQELADKLSVESSEIIKSLFFKGITATVTQSLDLQTIETEKKIVALGGINSDNLKNIKLTKSIGIASISWIKKNGLK